MSAVTLAQHASTAVTTIRDRTLAQSIALWSALPDYSDEGLGIWLSRVVPLVSGAQRAVGTLTGVYLASVLSEMTGKTVPPAIAPAEMVTGPALRNGVSLVDEYTRPFIEIWSALAQDTEFSAAVGLGRARMESMMNTDIQLARTHAARYSMGDARKYGVVGYRRVTSETACKLCQIAATQRYRADKLMPIHNNCHCGIAPITGKSDPGQVIDRAQAAEGAEYDGHTKNSLRRYGEDALTFPGVVVHEHGEIGPVLAVKGHAFTGPSEIEAATETVTA